MGMGFSKNDLASINLYNRLIESGIVYIFLNLLTNSFRRCSFVGGKTKTMETNKALAKSIYRHNLIIIALFCSTTLTPALIFFTTGPGEWMYLLGFITVSYLFSLLPLRFYDQIQWSQELSFYKKLRIHHFKKYVTNGDYINRSIRRKFPTHKNVSDLESINAKWQETYTSEKVHSVMFVFCLLTSIYALVIGAVGTTVFLSIGNLFLNYLPNLLQQYNRIRYKKVMDAYGVKGVTP